MPTALVIDDEPALLRSIARSLRGYKVTPLASAVDAIDAIRGGATFDVVVCDLAMPVMSGDQFYVELTASHPALAARVVFLTGGAPDSRTEAFLKATGRPVLHKPFTTAELAAAIAKLGAP